MVAMEIFRSKNKKSQGRSFSSLTMYKEKHRSHQRLYLVEAIGLELGGLGVVGSEEEEATG
jgi:hypothetical protein